MIFVCLLQACHAQERYLQLPCVVS